MDLAKWAYQLLRWSLWVLEYPHFQQMMTQSHSIAIGKFSAKSAQGPHRRSQNPHRGGLEKMLRLKIEKFQKNDFCVNENGVEFFDSCPRKRVPHTPPLGGYSHGISQCMKLDL